MALNPLYAMHQYPPLCCDGAPTPEEGSGSLFWNGGSFSWKDGSGNCGTLGCSCPWLQFRHKSLHCNALTMTADSSGITILDGYGFHISDGGLYEASVVGCGSFKIDGTHGSVHACHPIFISLVPDCYRVFASGARQGTTFTLRKVS